MPRPIRVLMVEDRPEDAELIVRELRRAGFAPDWRRVESEADYLAHLAPELDVILSDYCLPEFDGARALELLRERGLGVPFIIISGTVGEEIAVASMKQGASDYLLKDRLARLGQVVDHVLEQTRLRREHAEVSAALRRAESRYRSIFENAAEGIFQATPEGRFLAANPELARICGYGSPGELITSVTDVAHQLYVDAERWVELGRLLRKRGAVSGFEVQIRRRDGSLPWASINARASRGESGMTVYEGTLRDVTERRQAESSLAAQHAVSRALAESPSLSAAAPRILETLCEGEGWDFGEVFTADRRAGLLRCVATWHRPSIEAGELESATRAVTFRPGVGLPGRVWVSGQPAWLSDLAAELDSSRAALAARAELHAGAAFPIRQEGETLGVIGLLSRAVREPDHRLLDVFSAIGSQIGQYIEAKRAEEELLRFVSLSPAVLYALRIEPDGRLRHTWTSENVTRLTGFDLEKAYAEDWWPSHIHPDDRKSVLAAHPVPYEVEHQVLEYRFERKDGSYVWIADEKRLLRDADGRPSEVIGAWSEITQRKQIETQLLQAQKMEAIGQLSGGVAHDFNNLLTVIQMHASLLGSQDGLTAEVAEAAAGIERSVERASSLTRQLLAFSRRQVMQLHDFDLNEVVADITAMLRRILGEDVEVEVHRVAGPLSIRADIGMVEQVVMNLAVNARDAMPHGGRLSIDTSSAFFDERTAIEAEGARPGAFACLSVTDSGQGIPRELLPRIFEPFFTTKDVGKGTGLGLATVLGIALQHNGWIHVDSEVGHGATFHVYFPLLAGSATEELSVEATADARGGSETILLVEDEPPLRVLVAEALRASGYRILDAASGPGALELWALHRQEIDLVLTDMVMPDGMTGVELARRLREDSPQLKVIYTSGYSAELAARDIELVEGVNFLAKPFHLLRLVRAVRACLDGRTSPPA